MNVVLKLFALQPGRHSPAEALAGPLTAEQAGGVSWGYAL